MGSGISSAENEETVVASTTKSEGMDPSTFQALQSAYESSKDLDNAELFNVLAGIYIKRAEMRLRHMQMGLQLSNQAKQL